MSNSMIDQVGDAAESIQEKPGTLVAEGQKAAGTFKSEVRSYINAQLSKQKDFVADEISIVAKAMCAATDALMESPTLSYIHIGEPVAKSIENFANALRNKEVDDIVADTVTYARANPGVFIGAAVGIGFLTARFLKSRSAA